VLRYEHVCRRKGCHYVEVAKDPALRVWPEHDHKLWPKAIVRQIRFHDLRHTTASLLTMAGANPAAVQRILRHRDPRITTGDPTVQHRLEPEPARVVAGTKGDPFAAPVLQGSQEAQNGIASEDGKPSKVHPELAARHRRFELLTYGSGAQNVQSAPSSSDSQPLGIARQRALARFQPSHRLVPIFTPFGPMVVQDFGGREAGIRLVRSRACLLSVREVAKRLGVCTAIVYDLVSRGVISHVRVSNSIRIAPADLEAFLKAQRAGGSR
jgi:excisionase family DNA binding protein